MKTASTDQTIATGWKSQKLPWKLLWSMNKALLSNNMKNSGHKISFRGREFTIFFGEYQSNKKTAMVLQDETDPDEQYILSVNLVDAVLRPDQMNVKTWGENAGLLEKLQGAGILSESLAEIPTGYVKSPLVNILIPIPRESEAMS